MKISFFIPDLSGGGAEKAVINLLKEFSKQSLELELVLLKADGVFLNQVPEKVSIINLNKGRMMFAVRALALYFKKNKPDIFISHLTHSNIASLIAKKIARSKTKLIVVEHTLSANAYSFSIKEKILRRLMKTMYLSADAIVAVAEKTAREIELKTGLKENTIQCIYNPVVENEISKKSAMPNEHPWLMDKKIPVVLAAGRLVPEKDFATLIKAFFLARKKMPLKLIILGEGLMRKDLERLVLSLGINEDVSMPGFVDNPYSYMSRSDVFVLSSLYEGLGNVLIEAMACGCPVVSADCKGGPAEILNEGQFGILVPVSNDVLMAEAILKTIASSVEKTILIKRADYFSAEKSVAAYLSLINKLLKQQQ